MQFTSTILITLAACNPMILQGSQLAAGFIDSGFFSGIDTFCIHLCIDQQTTMNEKSSLEE